MFNNKSKMLTADSNALIHELQRGMDNRNQLHSIIHPDLHFRRNSVNLYIGRRGSGKTFNVMREIIKLSLLPNAMGYNSFIYCTNKTNDSTVQELLSLIKLKTRVVTYDNMKLFMKDFSDAKSAMDQIIRDGLQDDITDACKKDILTAVYIDEFPDEVPGTVVLYDDAINIFKGPKYKELVNLLFDSRHPHITYFLCMQDGFGIPAQIKRDVDTCIVFGGFNDKQMLTMLFNQLCGQKKESTELLSMYYRLNYREGLVFDNDKQTGLRVSVLRE
jgi:hypothetical protein